jgi:DNA modification methylase
MKAVANHNRDLRKIPGSDIGKESHAIGTRTGKNLSSAYAGVDWGMVGRNKRSVWEIATRPYSGAHFATFPKALVEPCIFAGSQPGDIILDPFAGSGTTGVVAIQHGRKFIGFDLNPEYCQKMAAPRLSAAERHQTMEQYESGQLTIEDVIGTLGDCMKSKGENR